MSEPRVWEPLREFKRKFHQLHKLADRYMAGGTIKTTMHWQDNLLTSSFSVPGDGEALRFAHLLQPHAHPQGAAPYTSLVDGFLEVAALPEKSKAQLREHALHVANGREEERLKLIVKYPSGQEEITGPRAFELVADGGLLRDDPAQVKNVEVLARGPGGYEILMFQFHSYCQRVYALLCHLYQLVREQEAAGLLAGPPLPALEEPCCIYCRRTKRELFYSIEHVYPESLGNTDFLLPIGAVCDPCNRGVLASLDDYLVSQPPVNVLRLLNVPVNPKSGRYVRAECEGFTLTRVTPRDVTVEVHGVPDERRAAIFSGVEPLPTSGRMDPVKLGRSFYKIGLGIVANQIGHQAALDPRYDRARDFVMGRTGFPNYLLLGRHCVPQKDTGHTMLVREGTIIGMSLYGFGALFNLEPEPLLDLAILPPEAPFIAYDLAEASTRNEC